MAETSIDVSGEMQMPPPRPTGGQTKFGFDLQSLQSLPSPMELIQMVRLSLRPWTVFFNISNFKSAVSMQRLKNRVMHNLSYFQSNYIFVFIVLMIYCLITSPLTLLVLAAVAYGAHRIRSSNRNLTIMGHTVTPKQQIIGLHLGAAPLLFLVGAGAVLFWTLGASCFVIFMHAVFYNIDAIVTEENEGFLAQVV
ncbi:prenylated Rab acceptor protein 1 [Drosophila grimshawi]|uniref:PRA1 family protein n=1 Tax=Drosophila grimshawi TaxID=7222 RepID=B4J9H2_DROGR|nr:prenylated Rab acceptor protein 1 [Drosophila grimshawi]EDW01453.1 GH20444 [Drosophila grimshawi]